MFLIKLCLLLYSINYCKGLNKQETIIQCYHTKEIMPTYYSGVNAFSIQCHTMCLIHKDKCGCSKQTYGLPWNMYTGLETLDVSCKNVTCAFNKGLVSWNGYVPLCEQNEKNFVWFDLTNWINNEKSINFMNILPKTSFYPSEVFTLKFLCFELYVTTNCQYVIDYDDGLTESSSYKNAQHTYIIPGVYKIKVAVDYFEWFKYDIQLNVTVNTPFRNIELTSCSHELYFLNDTHAPFHCTGHLYSGKDVTVYWNFDEQYVVPLNISGAVTRPFYFAAPCFHVCSESLSDAIGLYTPNLSPYAIFLMTHETFEYAGQISAFEVYARFFGTIYFQIFRKTFNTDNRYTKISSVEVWLSKQGYNTYLLSNPISVKQGDYVGFQIPSIKQLETINYGTIEVYSMNNMNIVKATIKKSIRFRFVMYYSIDFIMEYNFTMTGYHNISFVAKDYRGLEITSVIQKVAVSSYRPVISLVAPIKNAIINERFSLCVKIANGGLTKIKWATKNSGVLHVHDGKASVFNSLVGHEETSSASLQFIECISLKVPEVILYTFTISISIYDNNLVFKDLLVQGFPPVTGLKLEQLSVPEILYQLQRVEVLGGMNPYPLNHSLILDFGDNTTHLHSPNSTKEHYYKEFGVFAITLSVYFSVFVRSVTFNVTVLNTFELKSVPFASINDQLTFNLSSLIPYDKSWIYYWNFDDNTVLYHVGISVVNKTFTFGHIYNVECTLNIINHNISRTTQVTILEPIYNLKVEVKPGEKTFLESNFTMKASYTSGNELTFEWRSSELKIVSSNLTEITLWSDRTGIFDLSLNVSNLLYTVSTEEKFLVLDGMYYFDVKISSDFTETGSEVSFNISALGGSNKSFEFYFYDDNSDLTTSLINIQRQFRIVGSHKVVIHVLMNGLKETCYDFSLVPCNITVTLDVLNPIEDLLLYYYNSNNTKKNITDSIYHALKTPLNLEFFSVNGSNVAFSLEFDNETVPSINASPIAFDTVAYVPLSSVNFVSVKMYECKVKVVNKLNEKSKTFFIYVENVIENVTLQFLPTVELGLMTIFNATQLFGTNVLYSWNFEDGFQSNVNVFQRYFSLPKFYNFTLTMFNNVSRLDYQKTIQVISKITGFKLLCGNTYVRPKEQVSMNIIFHEGTQVNAKVQSSNNKMLIQYKNLNGPYNTSFFMIYENAGIVTVTVTLLNSMRELTPLSCIYTVEEIITSAFMSSYPTYNAYVSDPVLFSVGLYGGTNATGVLRIYTQNYLPVLYKLFKFKWDSTYKYSLAKLEFKFDIGDAYYLNVEAYNFVSRVNITTQSIFVIDNSKKKKLQKSLDLVAKSAVFGKATVIHIMKNVNFIFFYCDLNKNDSSPIIRILPTDTLFLTYIFQNPGKYYLTLKCLSSIGDINLETIAYVQMMIKIKNVFAPVDCIKYGDDLNISVILDDTQMLKYLALNLYLNSSEIHPTLLTMGVVLTFQIKLDQYLQSGLSKISVSLRNFVSEVVINRDVCVKKVIEDISCQTPVVWRYSVVTPFQITVKSESAVDLFISFGDSNVFEIKNHGAKLFKHSYMYRSAGMFNYSIQASNNVSTKYFYESIEVLQKLEDLTLIYNSFLTWPDNSVIFSLHFRGNISETADISYQIYFGDNHITKLSPLNFSSLKNNTILLTNHSYDTPGCYDIVFTAQGKLNNIVLQENVIISNLYSMEAIISSQFGKQNNSSSVYRADYPLFLEIKNAEESCFSFTYTVFDNETILYNEETVSASFILDILIHQPGVYKIHVHVITSFVNYSLPIVTFELVNGLPPIAILPLLSPHQVKNLIILTNDDPSVFRSINITYGDNTSESVIPCFHVFNETQFLNELVDSKLPFASDVLYYFNITHKYNSTGLFQIKLVSENQVSYIEKTRNIFVSELYCESPQVEIVCPANNVLSFHYRQKISILSHVKIKCDQSKQVFFHWYLFKSSKWEMDNGVTSVGKQKLSHLSKISHPSLNIDHRTLTAGYYIIKLHVVIEGVGLDSDDEIYLKIIEETLQVSIKGGSLQQLPWKESFILDASHSKDPNEIAQNELKFKWFCELQLENITTDCFGNGVNIIEYFGSQWLISGKTLLEGHIYIFKVVVTNPKKGRYAETFQKIWLVDEEIPVVTIRCQSNCRSLVNPSNRFSLTSVCTNCYDDFSVSYKWIDISLHNEKKINFSSETLTSQMSSNLVIKAGVLVNGGNYRFSLKVSKRSGATSYSEYYFETSRPPIGGSCLISPENGTSLETSFQITCSNWNSNIGSLNYRILRKDYDNEDTKLLLFGPLPTSSVLLSTGPQNNHFYVNIAVEIIDLYGAVAVFNLKVRVFPLIKAFTSVTNVENIQNELYNMTSGKGNQLEQLSGQGNTQGLMQFISTVTESINSVQDIETDNEILQTEGKKMEMVQKRKQMRSVMVDALTSVDVQSTDNVRQTADAIAPLLERADEVTAETQKRALESFSQMTNFLDEDEEVKEGENPEKVTEITRGLVTATGNLLEAIVVENVKQFTFMKNGTTNQTREDANKESKKKEVMTKEVLNIVKKVMPLLLIGKVSGEEPTRISSDAIALELSRQNINNFNGTVIKTMSGGTFKLPKALLDETNVSTIFDYKMSSLRQNPFGWHSSSTGIKSSISSLTFSSTDNKEVPVQGLIDGNHIEMFIPQTPQFSKILVNSSWITAKKLVVYQMNITGRNLALLASVNSSLLNVEIDLYFRAARRPTLTTYDYKTRFFNSGKYFEMFTTVSSTETYYLGIHIINHTSIHQSFLIELTFFTTGCLYWHNVKEIWDTSGCQVGPLTTPSRTQCLCNHLTWFGSNFLIPPNSLDIDSELLKLKNLDDYPALLATFCAICGVYILALIWARRKDKIDLNRGEPTFLRSQSSCSGLTYHIAVYTGHRGCSGTTATPSLILSGERADSVSLSLKNKERKLFDRGTVETFLFTSEEDLGKLKYLTIWHNDDGKSPSWFLSRLTITNLSDNKQYHCFCNDWLAVDQSDGLIERVLPIATPQEMGSFENIFLAKTARDLTDGHLWFSIISRPPRSNFTCMQRVSTCLCLLLSTMLSNAMFYNISETKAAGNEIDIGGFKVTWSEVIIGFQSSIIVLPMNILLVFLFRRAMPLSLHMKQKEKMKKRKPDMDAKLDLERQQNNIEKSSSKQNHCESFDKESHGLDFHFYSAATTLHESRLDASVKSVYYSALNSVNGNEIKHLRQEEDHLNSSVFNIPFTTSSKELDNVECDEQLESQIDSALEINLEESNISINLPESVIYWPFWVKYLAWVLCMVTCIIAGFFTLLYGLSFGKPDQEQWLISFFVSVFSDIIFNQPIKVIIFAALVTLVVRKLKDDYIICEIENFKNISFLEAEKDIDQQVVKMNRPLPPSKSYIELARKKRLYEAKMVDVVIEIVAYLVYMFLCMLITYGHRDPDAFAMTNNVEQLFVRGEFNQIKSIPDVWRWSTEVLSPSLYDRENYKGVRIEHDGFLADGLTFLLGSVRLRQLRVKKDHCIARGYDGVENSSTCGNIYTLENEDQLQQYCTKWEICRRGERALFPQYWRYQHSGDTGSYKTAGYLSDYDGGGYVVVLGRKKGETDNTLEYLQNNLWIDDFSRALFIDFTCYNTHANFYVMVSLMFELPPVGGVVASKRILTTRLDRYSSGFSIFLGVCEFSFLCFTLYYMYKEFKKATILKWSYIYDWRNWLEIASFACIWTCFALLLIRFGIVTMTKNNYFRNRTGYINFENAAIADQLYSSVLSFVALLMYLKFLKILRFNNKVSLMIKTVIYASVDLKYFFITFSICFLSFAQIGYLFFMHQLQEYSTFFTTIGSLFKLLLGKFKFSEIIEAKNIYGRIFFVAFIFLMSYILLNMFVCIIIEAFCTVSERMDGRANKYELMDFLKQRISAFFPAVEIKKKKKRMSDKTASSTTQNLKLAKQVDEAKNNTKVTKYKPISYISQPNNASNNVQITNKNLTKFDYSKKGSNRNESGFLIERKSVCEIPGENAIIMLENAINRLDAYVDDAITEEDLEIKILQYNLTIQSRKNRRVKVQQ